MNFYIPAVTHNFSYSKKFLSRLRFLNAKKNQPIKDRYMTYPNVGGDRLGRKLKRRGRGNKWG